MQLPQITSDQIQERCTPQSFERGEDYFYDEAIGNPVIHGWTLSATCQGTEPTPYRVSVELMPTGIADAYCSCPYDWGGDCKHIVALLLTYIHESEEICSVDTLFTTLAEKPKASLLRVISELLKREPALVPVARTYIDMAEESELESVSTASNLMVSATTKVYREQIDRLFGNGFLEQHQLREVLVHLKGLVRHAESLAQAGETEFALSILHALIHQSIVRYADTLQKPELPRFVDNCTTVFAQIVDKLQEPTAILEHYRMLLALSFEAESVFTSHLTHLLKQFYLTQDTTDLQTTIAERLEESRNRQAHVQLLLDLYLRSDQIGAAFRLARREEAPAPLISNLFARQDEDTAWEALEEFPLSVAEYWDLLKSPIAKRDPRFTEQLVTLVEGHQPGTAIMLYQGLIEQILTSQKRRDYKRVQRYLTAIKRLHQHLDQENQWEAYLAVLRKRHARKRLLLQIMAEI